MSELRLEWADDNVFKDVDTIEPGVDFAVAIRRTLERCERTSRNHRSPLVGQLRRLTY